MVVGLLVEKAEKICTTSAAEAFEEFDQGPPGVQNGSWRDRPLSPKGQLDTSRCGMGRRQGNWWWHWLMADPDG